MIREILELFEWAMSELYSIQFIDNSAIEGVEARDAVAKLLFNMCMRFQMLLMEHIGRGNEN